VVAEPPVVLDAGPRPDASDRPGAGFLRVTFSPDGDGRGDRVWIHVHATAGDRVVLDVRRESGSEDFRVAEPNQPSGSATLSWDGVDAAGNMFPVGSYVIHVCSASTRLCARTRILAHLRLLSVFTPRATAVSVRETIPVVIDTDRLGPYTLDLAPAANPKAPGAGAQIVAQAGRVDYRIPEVAGGLWLLRVSSGPFVTRFPLVVHEPAIQVDDPPRGSALVVDPYITWRAYDQSDLDRDGRVDSWYAHPLQPVVPLTGPFERLRREASLAGREASPENQRAFAEWMQKHHLVAQYVTDVELGRMPLDVLRRYAMIVFPGHTEYYERETYERLLRFRNEGGRLYFMSGNSFYGEVAVGRSQIVRLSYRYRTRERSDFRIAATGFQVCCWPASITPHYHLAAGVGRRLPWLLQGTTLRAGDDFGIAMGEVDTVDPMLSPRGTVTIASATVKRFSNRASAEATGWIGTRPFSYEPAGARERGIAIAYAATGRGEVFSWGDTGFMASLFDKALPATERADLDRVALNVWQRFTR